MDEVPRYLRQLMAWAMLPADERQRMKAESELRRYRAGKLEAAAWSVAYSKIIGEDVVYLFGDLNDDMAVAKRADEIVRLYGESADG